MNEPIWIKSVGVENNGDFINIQAYSGYSSAMADPTATEYVFIADVSNEVLGTAVLEAFKQCRLLSYEEACALEKNVDKAYANWIQNMMNRYGYETRRDLFFNMKSCVIEHHEEVLTFRPSHHEDLEVWISNRMNEENDIKIPVNSSPAEIGATLRLAFSRCTG